MKIIFPLTPCKQDWARSFGLERDQMAARILQGDWFQPWNNKTVVRVDEDPYHITPFTLWFVAQEAGAGQPLNGWPKFSISLDYKGEREDMRLPHVFFHSSRQKGLGQKLLTSIMGTAVDVDCKRVFVELTENGSWYWTRRGALIQRWPRNEFEINRRMAALTEGNYVKINWSAQDLETAQNIVRLRDNDGLNKIVARSGLFVDVKGEVIPFHRYLLNEVDQYPCIFNLDHLWKQKCLLDFVGFDVSAKRAARSIYSAELPGGSMGFARKAAALRL